MESAVESTPPTTARDHETVRLLRERHPDGMRMLVEDHRASVQALLRQRFERFLPLHEIDAALAAALVRIWEAPFAHTTGTLRAWLFVAARDCALGSVKRRQRALRRATVHEMAGLLDALGATPHERQRLRRIADVYDALTQLPPLQRAVLQADLDALGSEAPQVLARRLGVSTPTILRARHRGRAALATRLRSLGHYTSGTPAVLLPTPSPGEEPT